MNYSELKNVLIQIAIQEDIATGDHTSLACISKDEIQTAKIYAKDTGIVAGATLAESIFNRAENSIEVSIFKKDGEWVNFGETILTVKGTAIDLLTYERLALNFMQRMSGIATLTNKVVEKVKHTNVQILDTRKTTPGLRIFEKEAVKIGGGTNHRMGLYDMIMIKDNHIDFAGGVRLAIDKTNQYLKDNQLDLKIEIEVRNFEELDQVLAVGNINRIMLDNFTPEDIKKAVEIIDKKYETEASGGITIQNVTAYAEAGVDFISMGSLTHSAKNFDISMLAE